MNPPISHEAAANSGTPFSHPSRDTSRPVMLIGFQEQTNLGLGYLAAIQEDRDPLFPLEETQRNADVIDRMIAAAG